MLLFQVPFSVEFEAEAATITASVIQWSYIKPSPYWPCTPMDDFPGGTSVKILEREQDTFYVEYTKDGIVKRGYTPMINFNPSDYEGYEWCNHTIFTPGHNNTGSGADVYYGPGGSYAKVGAIDADEGIHQHKPLLVLRTQGSYSFIQYVTNPGTSGHVLFKRGWIQSSKITLDKPTGSTSVDNGRYAMLRCGTSGNFLQAVEDSSAPYGYRIEVAPATGYRNQVWYFQRYSLSTSGVYYKIWNMEADLVMEVTDFLPLVGQTIRLVPESSPNKAQEFAIDEEYGDFTIRTRCSGNYMILKLNGTSIEQNRKVDDYSEIWDIHSLNKFGNARYSNMDYSETEGTYILNYFVDPQIVEDGWLSETTTAITRWNNVSYMTGVKFVRCTDRSIADVYIQADYYENAEEYGYTRVYSSWNYNTFDGTAASFNTQQICGAKIVLNTYNLGTSNVWIHTLVHELGHALMMDHPFYELIGDTTLSNIGWDWVAYSVMNQGGLNENYPKIVDFPSYYDKLTLWYKWVR